jgi:hypothetical protein
MTHVTTALSPTWQWSLAVNSELTNVLPSQMPTPNVMHNITFGRNSAYRKHRIHIHLTSQSTEDRTRQWQFTNDLVFPIEFTLWLLRPSEGAYPRTRSRYEKNYLRFLVFFSSIHEINNSAIFSTYEFRFWISENATQCIRGLHLFFP